MDDTKKVILLPLKWIWMQYSYIHVHSEKYQNIQNIQFGYEPFTDIPVTEKKENACYQHFALFLTMCLKAFFYQDSRKFCGKDIQYFTPIRSMLFNSFCP